MSRHDIREAQRFVLDRDWGPIGVYSYPLEDQPAADEYSTYAGWIVEALLAGGGVEEVLSCLHRAGEWMDLEAPAAVDEPVARMIVERWSTRTS